MRRVLWTAAAMGVIGIAAAFLAVFLSRNTIAYSQKCGGNYCWGYRLEESRFSMRSRLTFWGDWGLYLQYELPNLSVERLSADRWLAIDRAVYLNLQMKPATEAGAAGSHVQILYDFQRGELHLTSPLPLWRAQDYQGGNPVKNWLTETEFEQLLTRIEP